ncbi:MAG: double zinc ribbon domain-containing protein [Candidatus Thorarchaeota archaeon]|jgi:uncharacterized OB-fold protein
MRCPNCRKTLEPDTKLCPKCKKPIIVAASNDSPYADILKPHSSISVKGLGSKMSGSHYVTATRHKITVSDESDSSQKIRCPKCGTVNDNSVHYCRKCGSRITH